MKDQLKTIREALENASVLNPYGSAFNASVRDKARNALTALTQLEAMVGAQQPVAWMGIPVMPGRYKEAVFCSDKDLAMWWDYSGHTGLGRLIVTPLYAAPVAQQPQAEPDWINGVPHWSPALIEQIVKQARADLEAENQRLREALERLARLGNGDHYGNSDGNMIARAALKDTK